jgi:hypothetical protein
MKYQKLKACIDTGRLQLELWDKVQHYFIVIASSLFAVMSIYLMFSAKDEAQYERSFLIFLISCFSGLVFYFILYRRLRFVIIDTKLSPDEIAEVIDAVAEKRKWKKATKSKNYYTATTPADFLGGSWGEQVAIILHKQKIYINSICDLKKPSVTAWGRNKKNVDVFRLELRKAETRKSFSSISLKAGYPT